jgi:hypothetical protein
MLPIVSRAVVQQGAARSQCDKPAPLVLPDLLVTQDVSHFHDVLQQVRSIDDANKKKRELEESQKAIEASV